jgi:hypothetical protein
MNYLYGKTQSQENNTLYNVKSGIHSTPFYSLLNYSISKQSQKENSTAIQTGLKELELSESMIRSKYKMLPKLQSVNVQSTGGKSQPQFSNTYSFGKMRSRTKK